MCYHDEFGRSTTNACKHRVSKYWRIDEDPPPWNGRQLGKANPKKVFPPHMCYLAERGRSALKVIGINRRKLPTLGNAGQPPLRTGVVADHKKHAPSPHGLPCRTLSFCVKRCKHIDRGEPQKLGQCWESLVCDGAWLTP